MRHAERLCQLYARVDRPILLLGPVGAGKTLLARAAHDFSRRPGAFVAVSAGELTEGLYGDALFGHLKGAFTGAIVTRPGVFEQAANGTVLFDDLALMPQIVQAAILRVIESRRYRPLGSADDRTARCRFLFASTKDTRDLVAEGRLIPDLSSRIGELIVPVPGLVARPEDIMPIAARTSTEFLAEHGIAGPVEFTDDVRELMLGYHWPENVRELRAVVERAVLHAGLTEGRIVIRSGHLPDRFHEQSDLARDQQHLSRGLVSSVLDQVDGNQSEAARRLGVHRNTIARYTKTAG
jgi:DNA-binding NtrC family response regulator